MEFLTVTLCTQLSAAPQTDRLHRLTRLWSQQPLGWAGRPWLGLHSLVPPGSAGGLPATSALCQSEKSHRQDGSEDWRLVHWTETRLVLVSVVSDQWLSGRRAARAAVEPPSGYGVCVFRVPLPPVVWVFAGQPQRHWFEVSPFPCILSRPC